MIVRTFPQAQAWGGIITYNKAQMPRAIDAIVNFTATSTDCDAAIVAVVVGANRTQSISVIAFYNAPTPGSIMNELLNIPNESANLQTQSFPDLITALSAPYANAARQRCVGLDCYIL